MSSTSVKPSGQTQIVRNAGACTGVGAEAGAGLGAGAGVGPGSGVATDSAWPDPVSGASSTVGAGSPVMSINERDIRAVEDFPSPSALRGVTANEYKVRGSSPVSVALGSVVLTVMASESCSEMAVTV